MSISRAISPNRSPLNKHLTAGLWALLVLAALSSVWALNGAGPLYYYDTGGYIAQGKAAFGALGIDLSEARAPEIGTQRGAGPSDDDLVSGDRSVLYALLLTGSGAALGYSLAALLQILVLGAALAYLLQLLAHRVGTRASRATIALPIIVACIGALPFYAALLMPDIYAATLILGAAVLGVAADRMSLSERALVTALITGSLLMHISNLGIAVGLIPVVLIGAMLSKVQTSARRWLAPALMCLAVLIGFGERLAFGTLSEEIEGKTAIYKPFVSVRLIIDGPGFEYLTERCPSQSEPSCALYTLLTQPNAPAFDMASILFDPHEQATSFRNLPAAMQEAIAQDQMRFVLRVFADRPVEVIGSMIQNALVQLNRFGIRQTLPTPNILGSVLSSGQLAPEPFASARLLGARDDLKPIETLHRWAYGLALAALLGGLAFAPAPRRVKIFVLILLAGIAINAAICGALSQPAPRYGGRVIWLVLIGATVLWLYRRERSARR